MPRDNFAIRAIAAKGSDAHGLARSFDVEVYARYVEDELCRGSFCRSLPYCKYSM